MVYVFLVEKHSSMGATMEASNLRYFFSLVTSHVLSNAQVLLSIQTQILVAEPYFNEPGMENERTNPEARARSLRTNQQLRLETLRHAVNDVLHEDALTKQWPELKGVLVQHFWGIRRQILQVVK